MVTSREPGVFFQQVKKFETPLVPLVPGAFIQIPKGGNVQISIYGIDAVMFTLDRDNNPTWHIKAVPLTQPWRMPNNRVFVAEMQSVNAIKLTTITAVQQGSRFWLISEEKNVEIFYDEQGLWSPQLWGRTAEVILLKKLGVIPLQRNRTDFKHSALKIGQVAFWHFSSGTGAVCTGHNEDGTPILARAYWREVPERKFMNNLRGLKAGEVVSYQECLPVANDSSTSFKTEVKGVGVSQ